MFHGGKRNNLIILRLKQPTKISIKLIGKLIMFLLIQLHLVLKISYMGTIIFMLLVPLKGY